MSHTMLYPAAIGKIRQPVPWHEGLWEPDFGLHRPANEYRLKSRSVLAAGDCRRADFFEQKTAQDAVHYWEKLR
jgi:hypothetical protein